MVKLQMGPNSFLSFTTHSNWMNLPVRMQLAMAKLKLSCQISCRRPPPTPPLITATLKSFLGTLWTKCQSFRCWVLKQTTEQNPTNRCKTSSQQCGVGERDSPRSASWQTWSWRKTSAPWDHSTSCGSQQIRIQCCQAEPWGTGKCHPNDFPWRICRTAPSTPIPPLAPEGSYMQSTNYNNIVAHTLNGLWLKDKIFALQLVLAAIVFETKNHCHMFNLLIKQWTPPKK